MPSPERKQAPSLVTHAHLQVDLLEPVRWLQLAWDRRSALDTFSTRLSQLLGQLVPLRPNTVSGDPHGPLILWDGPGRWLIRGGPDELPARLRDCSQVNVSDSLVGIRVSGSLAQQLIATGCPLDLEVECLRSPACARSLYQHIPLLLFRHGDSGIDLYVPVSFGQEFIDILTRSACAVIALNSEPA